MKNKATIIFIMIMVLVVTAAVIFGLVMAENENINPNEKPKIEVEPPSYNFGDVKKNDKAKHSLLIKNAGQGLLKIKNVSTSCACTKARTEKKELASGESTDLLITYDSGYHKNEIGKVFRKIYIVSNDPESPEVEIPISANVVK